MKCLRLLVAGAVAAIHAAYAAGSLVPITFEEARSGPGAMFFAHEGGYRLMLKQHEAWMASRDGQVLRIRLEGSRDRGPSGVHRLITRSNYILGTDPTQWRTGIANFERVTYGRIYPGVELVWHGNGGQIEHDFLLSPGADVRRIRLGFEGPAPHLTPDGDLVASGFVFRAPHAFQDGREISCQYELRGREVRFVLGRYDHSRPLTIDPTLAFSTLLGGDQTDSAAGIALDHAGNVYVAGTTASSNFPATSGAFQPNPTGDLCPVPSKVPNSTVPCTDIFVSKLSADGSTLLFSTYLGGPGNDVARGVSVDSSGNLYLFGGTAGKIPKLAPLTGQTAYNSCGLFVAKLSADGSSLLYATCLPPGARAIAVDAAGALYITGTTSAGLPVVNAFQSAPGDAILFKTTDAGNHWQGITNGLPMMNPSLLGQDPTNPQVLYIAFLGNGLFQSTDGGAHWNALNNGLDLSGKPEALAIDPRLPQTLYLAMLTAVPRLYKSVDRGASWVVSGAGITGFIRALAIDPSNSTVYAASTDGLFKSTDGNVWNLVGLPSGPATIAVAPSPMGTIYAGFAGTGGSAVMKSTDAGATWTAVTNGLPPSGGILALAIDPVNPQILYASFNGSSGVYKTTDSGAHWILSLSALANQIVVDPSLHSRVWSGTDAGLLVSLDFGSTWTTTPNPLPQLGLIGLTADTAGNLYGLSPGFGGDAFAMKLDKTGSQILYSTYLGGLGQDQGSGIAVDAAGRAYITGQTDSPDFPLANAVQPHIGGGDDAFVTVLDPTGARLSWSTYFGGSGAEQPPALAIDGSGNAHLAGMVGQSNAYAAKLKSDGSAILYSTQLGATGVSGVAADAMGNTYVAGPALAAGLPTPNGIQPAPAGRLDAFVTGLDGKTGAVQFATYLGGSGADYASGVAADSGGDVYVAGTTSSPDFPQKYSLRAYGNCTPSGNGCLPSHVFVTKLAAPGNGPALRLDAVTNAASYGATLAPGELVTIWGGDLAVTPATSLQTPLPTQLSDVHVAVNGVAAPLIYASASQINAQIPFETAVGPAQLQISSSAGTGTVPATIAAAAPAIFTLNLTGTGPGAILHGTTYQVVTASNPAAAGEIISIYCTGLGAVSPPAQTGGAPPGPPSQTVIPVQVSIGGAAAQVLYQGVAPGFPGLYQVNAQIPAATPSGAEPLQIVQNGAASNTVTVAVQ